MNLNHLLDAATSFVVVTVVVFKQYLVLILSENLGPQEYLLE